MANPPGANVRTFQRADSRSKLLGAGAPTADTHKIAHARVQLKLAALAYADSRHGTDSNDGMVLMAVALLARASFWYVGALENVDRSGTRIPEPDGRFDHIKLAALAYVGTRHGGDGGGGFCRDGLALLCQAAIRFVESIDKVNRANVVDHTLKLDDGM